MGAAPNPARHVDHDGPPTWGNAGQKGAENPTGMLLEIGAKSCPNGALFGGGALRKGQKKEAIV